MSGGMPRTGVNSNATIKYNGASNEPGLSIEEQVRRKRAELGTGPVDPTTGRPMGLPPDLADIAMRDLGSGRVHKARGGSTRQSILGSALTLAAIVGLASWVWLRALLRGEL